MAVVLGVVAVLPIINPDHPRSAKFITWLLRHPNRLDRAADDRAALIGVSGVDGPVGRRLGRR